MALEILYRDAHILVCIKPAGVLSEEGGMPGLLRAQTGVKDILCVHRLDRAVGGLMVYAGSKEAAASLSRQFAEGAAAKQYLAVCRGDAPDAGEMRDLLFHDASRNKSYVVKRMRKGVREAALRFETLQRRNGMSLVRIELLTGRSHQIRVQFASRQLPLAGDRRYGGGAADGPALWSHELCFRHPKSGEALSFRAPPPAELPWTVFSLQL